MFNWLKKTQNYLPPVYKEDGSKTRIFVGVSGGVDSSVSAALLKDKGYDVTGVFMRTYYPPEIKCDWREERLDALRVCEHLDIPFLECDLEEDYKQNVFDYMIEAYKNGITPNPDVFCNKYVKFGGFLKWALEQDANYVATGHYAQNIFNTDGVFELVMGADQNKDQTYFLYQLQQHQLKHALFPIGHIEKSQVRTIAKKYGLFTATKKDSQGLCFVGPVDMRDFLGKYIEDKPGDVLDLNGQVIGSHKGAFFLTIGQRTGFEIAPEHRTPDMPKLFIVSKDASANTVTVSRDVHAQNTDTITLAQISWTDQTLVVGETVQTRIRHRGKLLPATLELVENNQYTFSFETVHTGVAAGQSLVLYRNNVCLGGGIVI